MHRHVIATALLLAVAGLALLVGTSQAQDGRKREGHEQRRERQPIEGRFALHKAEGSEVVVIDTVTGAVYTTEGKTITTVDVVGGRVITRTLEAVDQTNIIRAR